MKKVIRLTENDIEGLVKKILKESPRGGEMMYGNLAEIIDEVTNRVNEYGDEYIEQLETLNSGFPVTKYKKIEPPWALHLHQRSRNTKRDFELPPNVKLKNVSGLKVRSTVYPK